MRTTSVTAATAAVLLALSGCGSTGGTDGGAGAERSEADLRTAASDLGTIVVDSAGRTVYVFDGDSPGSGTSACTGTCAQTWPPVAAESDQPDVDGVTGEVGTIPRDDGAVQVTLDGRPLYRYAGDPAAGDVTGQGIEDAWWVVAPGGAPITEAPSVPEAPAY